MCTHLGLNVKTLESARPPLWQTCKVLPLRVLFCKAMELFVDYHILGLSNCYSLVPQEADMAIVGTGEEGYFVPPTKGTSPTQVGVDKVLALHCVKKRLLSVNSRLE